MSAQQPESSEASTLPSAEAPTRTIACVICQAVYTPSRRYEHLLLAPPIALESAFMGMCHFCFRCRRPSCPQCWDDVHGICAQCGQESRLPFRRATAPLSPLLFTASRQAQLERVQPTAAPFICLEPGKFQYAQPGIIEETATAAMQVIEHGKPEKSEKSELPPQDQITVRERVSKVEEIEEIATLPERASKNSRRGGHFITTVLCVLLVLLILCIVAAYFSADVNALISSTLHVDIRAEIAYLWQLITHLF